MKISKTIFKEYSRCPRVCGLDNLYMKRLETDASIFGADDEQAEFIELLRSMYDEESGEDLIDVIDPQLEALLPYYNQLEKHAMSVATKIFGDGIIYSLKTKEQKLFSFSDSDHTYVTYLDGFQETEDEIRIFEVKATSSKKFLELGPKVKGEQTSIFTRVGHVLRLDEHSDIPPKKFEDNYQKLFDRFSDVGNYTFDMAVERFMIERSLKVYNPYKNKKIKFYLVVLNHEYTFDGTYDEHGDMVYSTDKMGNELVLFLDLTDITKQFQPKIETMYQTLLKNIDALEADPVRVGRHCQRKKQSKCAFVKTCWASALKKGSILEYLGNHHGFKDEYDVTHDTVDLINKGEDRMDSVPKRWLQRLNNQIQRDCFESGKEYINYDKIIRGIKTLKYPIYHLDFESFPCPLPRFAAERPYNQSVFQFSIHIEHEMGKCDKHKDHYEYLAPDSFDHRLEMVEKMIEIMDLSNGGTVLVYNKSFEHTRIKEFAGFFPQHAKALEKINDHMFDLLDLVSTRSAFYRTELGFSEEESKTVNYYHNDLVGSYSIKKVLPIFSDLTYKGMGVANGTEAIAAYARFATLSEADLIQLRQDLVEYCKQDTWAMVVVLWGLMDKVGYKKLI